MNKLHELEFPKTLYEGEKKTVGTLYIDADEDHVALPKYLRSKGDIPKPRSNTIVRDGVCLRGDRYERRMVAQN